MSYPTFTPFCMWINMYQEVNLVGSTWILGCLTVGQYVTKLEMCQVQNIIEADGTSITSSWIIFCGTSSSFVACFLEIRLWAFVVLYTEMPNLENVWQSNHYGHHYHHIYSYAFYFYFLLSSPESYNQVSNPLTKALANRLAVERKILWLPPAQ